ncbi:hypothetical protein [Pseudoalteromonas spongiae]|uniref:hypothetical protein n=1 Tax=Pseudoalteromonas spongiae TaxID=298657 RepID=UPI00026CBE91|nr:hypothetical protein [Pseudoalteromonas spongiae]ATD00647.1 hypothetical protein PSPO_b0671 [Pseudoalteromonas spongiae UST010723-006]
MLNVKKNKQILLCILVFLVFQLVYGVAKRINLVNAEYQLTQHIENRIAKDLNRLPLPDPNKSSAGNDLAVANYITALNEKLTHHPLLPKVLAIQSNNYDVGSNRKVITHQFSTPTQVVRFAFSLKKLGLFDYFSWLALIASIGFYFLVNYRYDLKLTKNNLVVESIDEERARLVIDLEQKLLINSRTHTSVPLANKPLCFYTALIEYCMAQPDVLLNQNKELPDELVSLANKYFYRLTELGHTIRKRPNFSNSLEKTLSEIRAALDEILLDDIELKDMLYPPKAHGEGSRSKLHHYGLRNVDTDQIEIIGK